MPKTICTVSIKDGKAYFRHPVLKDKTGKRGRAIQRGVSRLTPGDLKDLRRDLDLLLARAPRTRVEAPTVMSELATELYFGPMEADPQPEIRFDTRQVGPPLKISEKDAKRSGLQLPAIDARVDVGGVEGDWDAGHINAALGIPDAKIQPELIKALQRISFLENQVNALTRERDAYKDRMAGVEQRVGEQTEAERETPLAFCLSHFNAHFTATSDPETQEAKRRVKTVLDPLAAKDLKYGEVTKQTILAAVKESGDISDFERSKREAAVKRFFNFICLPVEEGGLEFRKNPAANVIPEAVSAIQHRKRQEGSIETLDPRIVLKKAKDPYWRAVTAVIGFAGLRLSEVARLRWRNLQAKDGIIDVPGKKTSQSLRCGHPFPNVWQYIEAHKQVLKREPATDGLVFPKPDGTTWIVKKGNDGRQEYCPRFSAELSRHLELLGLPDEEPALRLRRWWSTTMKTKGYSEQERIFGGHTRQTADDYYLNSQAFAKGTELKPLPNEPET